MLLLDADARAAVAAMEAKTARADWSHPEASALDKRVGLASALHASPTAGSLEGRPLWPGCIAVVDSEAGKPRLPQGTTLRLYLCLAYVIRHHRAS
jgi:hypothetical protein